MDQLIDDYEFSEFVKNIEFYKAVDGRKETIPLSFRGNSGAYGCTRSHLNVLQEVSDKGLENVLIVEDDLILHKDFKRFLENTNLPDDYKVAYLGATQICWDGISVKDNWYRAKRTLGTTAYIVRDGITANMIVNQWTGVLPIDEHLVRLQDEYSFYVHFPNIMIQNVGESRIRTGNFSWSLDTVSNRLKWNLEDYDFSEKK